MNYILFDGPERQDLLPLTFTRPISELRVGIFTIKEKWELHLNEQLSYMTDPYLANKFPTQLEDDNCIVNASIIPNKEIINAIQALKIGERLIKGNTVIAACMSRTDIEQGNWSSLVSQVYEANYDSVAQVWHVFSLNGAQIKADLVLMKAEKSSISNGVHNTVLGDDLYVHPSAEINASILNTKEGPIYIGKDVKILEGSIIRGPLAICEGSVIKMGAKIYGDTTIGPYCKVGGEISNSVFQAYSNKGHDGYLGNSVIGEWCNLGADTNSSNLKNNYGEISIWNYKTNSIQATGLQFCGLVMGDHAKTGINTMLNTGTVVGVAANIFGGGFPNKFIPSFTWGGIDVNDTFKLEKAFEVAEKVMERRNVALTEDDKLILSHVFKMDEIHRTK